MKRVRIEHRVNDVSKWIETEGIVRSSAPHYNPSEIMITILFEGRLKTLALQDCRRFDWECEAYYADPIRVELEQKLQDEKEKVAALEKIIEEMRKPSAVMIGGGVPDKVGRNDHGDHLPHPPRRSLSFATLREANDQRQAHWDKADVLAGNVGILYKAVELAGEAGELCNKVKKYVRELYRIPGSRTTRDEIRDELADVVICVDLLASSLDMEELSEMIERKFTKTSIANKLPVGLHRDRITSVDLKSGGIDLD